MESLSKRRKGFPSESRVKKGIRGAQDKEFLEKLGRNDLCPCDSTKRFKFCCMLTGFYDGENRNDYVRN